MSLCWKCDRCGATTAADDVDDLPVNWRGLRVTNHPDRNIPSREVVLCDSCDDDLYDWFYAPTKDGER